MEEKKNCLNCMGMVPVYDGDKIVGRECMNNPGMRVNGRMHCEEWRSDDFGRSDGEADGHARTFVGAVSVTGVKHEKVKNG
jgi:hypothetical protein